MQLYTISVPAKPHIAKYAAWHYGNPVMINANTTLGALINALIANKNFKAKHSPKDLSTRIGNLSASIKCAAPFTEMIKGKSFALAHAHVISINQFLENDFKERLYFYCQRHANWHKRRAGIDLSIEDFAKFYNIEINEDISMDALRKMEYRFRQIKYKKIFAGMSTQKNSPQMMLI